MCPKSRALAESLRRAVARSIAGIPAFHQRKGRIQFAAGGDFRHE